jgi:hypothetical protein
MPGLVPGIHGSQKQRILGESGARSAVKSPLMARREAPARILIRCATHWFCAFRRAIPFHMTRGRIPARRFRLPLRIVMPAKAGIQ